MIPQEKRAAVSRGLWEAFGATEFEDILPMTKGQTSALVFRIVVKGRPYLLRLIMRANLIIGPERQFTCMRAAAKSGLAPHVWYTSVEDGLTITGFVEETLFPAAEALLRLPSTLRSLHNLPPFPRGVEYLDTSCLFLLHKGAAVDGFLRTFQEASLLSKNESEEFFGIYEQLASIYECHAADMVSSHNDLFKPDNILFDGQRVWLVDWEAAFLNDRYADLAVVANLVVTNDKEEKVYLEAYFGQAPNEYQLARFFLMRQVSHMFYAMAFLLQGPAGEPVSQSGNIPRFRDFQRRMWLGEVNLVDKEMKRIYGRVHFEQLLENKQRPRFNEAVSIVSSRRESANGEERQGIMKF